MAEKIDPRSANGNQEERSEKGRGLIVIGALLWIFDAFIFFFMPAGIRLGEQRPFAILIISAFIGGAVMMAFGVYLRKERL